MVSSRNTAYVGSQKPSQVSSVIMPHAKRFWFWERAVRSDRGGEAERHSSFGIMNPVPRTRDWERVGAEQINRSAVYNLQYTVLAFKATGIPYTYR